ncbi:MAG TPA: hypothetical protein VGI16_15820 [Candidatus Acidoferrum sp.]|jgi:hypothetical protein
MAGPTTFHYHASAHALSGTFSRPIQHLIEVQAATALPTIGGHGNARVDDFRLNHLVSFKSGYTHVSGSEQKQDDKRYFTTLCTSTVEHLNYLDVVTADRVVARTASYYLLPELESHFTFVGSRFDNLRVAGYPVEIELHEPIVAHLDTFQKVKKGLESDKEFKKMAEDPFHTGTRVRSEDGHGEILCSLVRSIKTSAPGVTVKGHALIIPHFGKVFVMEALVGPCKRTLTMLRLELGSPVQGTQTVGQVVGNGEPWP